MPANFTTGLPDIKKLKTSLQQSNLQETDRALFQTISLLIDWLGQYQVLVNASFGGAPGGGSGLNNATFITVVNETVLLPNSKQLNAGDQIEFDDSVPGIRTINALAYPPQLGFTGF